MYRCATSLRLGRDVYSIFKEGLKNCDREIKAYRNIILIMQVQNDYKLLE